MASTHTYKIYLGNKNYSSWSLRPWLVLNHVGVSYQEEVVPLYESDSKERVKRFSPTGKVPVLEYGDLRIWESLAICEYLAETFHEKHLWPAEIDARAFARSVSNEMHAGFAALRQSLPMDIRGRRTPKAMNADVERDIARVKQIWRESRERFGSGGKLLFGSFSIADAMFAPVVTRFTTYGIEVDATTKAYMDAVWALPAMQRWKEAAEKEPWAIDV
jgi:glutathione S-transferase